MSVDRAYEGQKKWEMFQWQDRLEGAGAGSVETLILELQARHRTMVSLQMTIARTPPGVNLFEVRQAPRKEPQPPSGRVYMEGSEPPISAVLLLQRESPGAQLEVLSIGRLAGRSVVSGIKPHLDNCSRQTVSARLAAVVAGATATLIPDLFLVFGLIGWAVGVLSILVVGAGTTFATGRLIEWAFPPLEFLPNSTARTRWQKAQRAVTALASLVVGTAGILGLILTLTKH